MNVQLIINAIVRQTTVLIAQVATTSGMRSPLAKVANQVFLDLVTELERQGLSRKIVADMFGLALRSYQQKVDRLTESASARGVSLWEAVYAFLKQSEVASRAEVLRRFARDDDASVKSILKDLVESGLVYQRGRGEQCSYRVASDSDLARDPSDTTASELGMMVWVLVYREGPISEAELCRRLNVSEGRAREALALLLEQGRVTFEPGVPDDAPIYSTRRCVIALGDEAGWEAALVDHYQAVVSAMCSKLRNGNTKALPPDIVGGSTYSFNVWPGHPYHVRAEELLAETRTKVGALWSEVAEYNLSAKPPESGKRKVTFYCGQSVLLESESEEAVFLDTAGPEIDVPSTPSEHS
jgi:hypothetical protein